MSKTTARHANRGSFFNAPANARLLSEWTLLPLRIFLGTTFLYAGFQKLANPNFFINESPISIHSQLSGAARFSPIHALLSHMIGIANPIGMVIAYAELAVGLGILIGLFSRIAAIGGALLSFSLFLAVSFHTSPYFANSDIVYFFAWLPFILAGSPPKLSVDAWLATKTEKNTQIAPNEVATPVEINALSRRKIIVGSAAAATATLGTLITGSAVAATGKLVGNAKTPTTNSFASGTTTSTTRKPSTTTTRKASTTTTRKASTTTTRAPANGGTTGPSSPPTTLAPPTTTTPSKYPGVKLGSASQVTVGKPATFTTNNGDPGIVFNQGGGKFIAYNTVCSHAGCTVGYNSGNTLQCPCHGAQFLVSNGNVIGGPAPHGLIKLNVVQEADGNLYLQ